MLVYIRTRVIIDGVGVHVDLHRSRAHKARNLSFAEHSEPGGHSTVNRFGNNTRPIRALRADQKNSGEEHTANCIACLSCTRARVLAPDECRHAIPVRIGLSSCTWALQLMHPGDHAAFMLALPLMIWPWKPRPCEKCKIHAFALLPEGKVGPKIPK